MLTASPEAILAAAEDAYARISVARDIPKDIVHRRDICAGVSDLMLNHEILANDPDLRCSVRIIDSWGNTTWPYYAHAYLVSKNKEGDDMVIDASWQQFLPYDTEFQDQPKVLMGNRRRFVSLARVAGVATPALNFWRPLSSVRGFCQEL